MNRTVAMLRAAVVTGLVLAVQACAPSYSPGPLASAARPTVLAPGDRVRVLIFGEETPPLETTVGEDGTLALPLAGRIRVVGLAPNYAEEVIAHRLEQGGLLTDPKVTIEVLQYRPIYVIGEVTRPGAYEYASHLQAINAIALAGGYTYRAEQDRVAVLRRSQPGERPVAVPLDTVLEPGDVLIVPERWF